MVPCRALVSRTKGYSRHLQGRQKETTGLTYYYRNSTISSAISETNEVTGRPFKFQGHLHVCHEIRTIADIILNGDIQPSI